jgi:hypothetical protein
MSDPFLQFPRIYTAIAEWLFCLCYIIYAKKRFGGWKFFGLIVLFLAILIGFHTFASTFPLFLWIPGMVFGVLLMFTFIYVTVDVNLITAGYLVIQAFVMAEFTASFYWQIYYYAIQSFHINFQYLSELLLFIIYGLVFALIFYVESRYKNKRLVSEVKQNDLLSFIWIGTFIFTMSNMSFISVNTPLSGRYPAEIFYIRTLVDFSGIIILYSQREHKRAVNTMMELHQMDSLLSKQYEQYSISQDVIDIINQKYHDLKNQLSIIRQEKNIEIKEKHLDQLGNDIKWYEAQYNTGNHVLDTILTSKSLSCMEKHINISCIADGELLNFISTMDLCSIFGNALDNAIENMETIEDPDKRLIKIAVFSQNQLLLIRFENYFVHPLNFQNGIFLTTKKDTLFHGFGLKSIRQIVDKYSGSVSIKTENNWFNLVLLIPIQTKWNPKSAMCA